MKERPLSTSADWQRFFRERKRAEWAITNREFFSFAFKFWIAMLIALLIAHLGGRL